MYRNLHWRTAGVRNVTLKWHAHTQKPTRALALALSQRLVLGDSMQGALDPCSGARDYTSRFFRAVGSAGT